MISSERLTRIFLASAVALYGPTADLAASGQDQPLADIVLQETAQIRSSDGDVGDLFGFADAVSGDTAISGAPGDDSQGLNSGSAYIFQQDVGGVDNWGEVIKLNGSDPADGDSYGSAVAIDGDTAVVGASFHDDLGNNSGTVYIYGRDNGGPDAWGEVKEILAPDGQAEDFFGFSIAISGDLLLVGAPGADAPLADAGATYVFERNLGGIDNWGFVIKLTASSPEPGDAFGTAVSIDGTTGVVGAAFGLTSDAGAAYIYEADQGWAETATLTAGDGDFGNQFGSGVDIDGNTVVSGAPFDDELGLDAGSAYIYDRNEGGLENWGEVTKLLATDGGEGDWFGFKVSVSGDYALVGAQFADPDGEDSGSAYVFDRTKGGDNGWGERAIFEASDIAAGDRFGVSTAVDGFIFVVGTGTGEAAYVYDISPFFEPVDTCVVFPNFCDSLEISTLFGVVSGTWINWDCEGADQQIGGFVGPSNTVVTCSAPTCPLGHLWAFFLNFNTEQFDLWEADGTPPPEQQQDDEVFIAVDGLCPDPAAAPLGGGVSSIGLKGGAR